MRNECKLCQYKKFLHNLSISGVANVRCGYYGDGRNGAGGKVPILVLETPFSSVSFMTRTVPGGETDSMPPSKSQSKQWWEPGIYCLACD